MTEYEAAHTAAAVLERSDRAIVRVYGRDPLRMVHNLVSNDVQSVPVEGAIYATLLTPKGRMVTDLRIVRRADDLLLECAADAAPALIDTWKRSVPPLFARLDDVSRDVRVLGVYGPDAARTLSLALGGEPIDAAAAEDSLAVRTFDADTVRVLATRETGSAGFDVFMPSSAVPALRRALQDAGAVPISAATFDVLRIEAGRPRWGAELTADVIPLEAGLLDRAFSTTKGCYTGQEVIIRILHRGHVNWHLRGMLLGESPVPPSGTALVRAGETKSVGRITSAAVSPRFAQTIALGYVRREIEPPATLHLASPDGAPVRVVALPFEAGSA